MSCGGVDCEICKAEAKYGAYPKRPITFDSEAGLSELEAQERQQMKWLTFGKRASMTRQKFFGRTVGKNAAMQEASAAEWRNQIASAPPTFENVERALRDGRRFEDVAPVGVSRSMFETERMGRILREEWRRLSPDVALTSTVLAVFDAVAASTGPMIADLLTQAEKLLTPPRASWGLTFQKQLEADREREMANGVAPAGPSGITPPDALPPGIPRPTQIRAFMSGRPNVPIIPTVNPFDKDWAMSVHPDIVIAAQEIASLPGTLVTVEVQKGKVTSMEVVGKVSLCDCGAEKCKTTHANWCSSRGAS